MFDTVRLSTEDVELDLNRLRVKGWTKLTREKMDCEGMIQSGEIWRPDLKGKHPHYLQYTPSRGELKLETSLPKVLYGENVSLLKPDDVTRTLDEISNRVSDFVGGAILPVSEWDVRGRIDAVFSWQAGAKVADYLHAFKAVELPRHYSQAVDRQATLYWRNSQRVLRLYDKHREQPDVSKSRGQLRFEAQLNHAKGELEKMGTNSTKAKDILNWQNARAILDGYLTGLGADLVVTSEEKLFSLLVERCGATKAVRLMGFISASKMFGRDELIERGFKRNYCWRSAKEIAKAGASVGTSKSGLLPPLTLPADYDGAPGRLK